MKNVLLLENRYKKKYRNLALMKFSTYYKNQGYNVDYFSGMDKKNTLRKDYDYICYSTIFTFYFDEDIKTIKYYQDKYKNAEFMIGGVSATLMPKEFKEATGIKPHIGLDETIEHLKPDYDLFPDHPMSNISEVFTARGCRNKCSFCAVKTLEPTYYINESWKDAIDLSKPKVMIHDNNLITGDFNHFINVTNYVKENNLTTIFDNGFDCRSFNQNHLEAIKDIKFNQNGLRFAFDNMSEDKHIQRALKMCLDTRIKKNKIMVYVLFNFNDDFEESFYRASEVYKLGARPYPQQYRPLDDKQLKSNHIGKHWSKELVRNFRFYWMMPGIYTKRTWNEYINLGGHKIFG